MVDRAAVDALREVGVPDPVRDYNRLADFFDGEALVIALDRRRNREPISQILGFRDFWKDRFRITADVLDPRPDSEIFLDVATNLPTPKKILDLGAGSGCLGLSLLREFPNAHCDFADISYAALDVARLNAQDLGHENVSFMRSDWFFDINDHYDLIVCNPPYITAEDYEELEPELAYEPRIALTDGDDGLSVYRALADELDFYLAEGGQLLVEHGAKQQFEVTEIFENVGFSVNCYRDLSNNPRLCQIFR